MFVHFNCFLLPSRFLTLRQTSAGSTWASLHKIKLQRRARREEVCNVKTKSRARRAQVTRRRNSKKIVFKCLLDRIKAAATVTFYLKLNSTRSVSMKNFALFSLLFCSAHKHDTNETRSILIGNAAAAESSCWPVGRNGIWENVCNLQLNDTMTSFAFQFSFMIDDNTMHSSSDKTCRNTRRAPISRSWAAVVLCCFSSISTNILNIFHYCTLDDLSLWLAFHSQFSVSDVR